MNPYLEAARAADLEPLAVTPSEGTDLYGCAGLLLTGGNDVNPKRYGQEPLPETESPDDERDEYELKLIREALERDLPIFAICRGHQLLNVYHGGTLIQHLPSDRHVRRTENKGLPAHEVRVEPDTLLAAVTDSRILEVNSRHHQAIDRLGAGLRVSARDAEDQTIEAFERPGKTFVLSVQWHPENQVFEFLDELKLFRAFAEAVQTS